MVLYKVQGTIKFERDSSKHTTLEAVQDTLKVLIFADSPQLYDLHPNFDDIKLCFNSYGIDYCYDVEA